MKIGLIIFTRNEIENSKRIFKMIPRKVVNATYVIDGNSTDGTIEFWRSKRIKVFDQKYKGVGGAYESAFRNTKEEALIFFHPDGNMNPNDIKKFVKLLESDSEFIIASRMIKGAINEEDSELLKPRKWFCQTLGIIANVLWARNGNKCTDITQGYRAFTRIAWNKLNIKIPNAVAPDYEQVIRGLKNKVKITEFGTEEKRRVYGETSMRSIKTGKENLKVLFNEIFKV